MPLSQRLLYFFLLPLFGCPAPRTKTPNAAPGDTHVVWLKENDTPVRSIDPADLDFSGVEWAKIFDAAFFIREMTKFSTPGP